MTAKKVTETPTNGPADADRVADLERAVAELNAKLSGKADNGGEDPDNGTFARRAAERAARIAAGAERARGGHFANRVVGPPVVHQ